MQRLYSLVSFRKTRETQPHKDAVRRQTVDCRANEVDSEANCRLIYVFICITKAQQSNSDQARSPACSQFS